MDENEQKNRSTMLRCQEWTYGKGKKSTIVESRKSKESDHKQAWRWTKSIQQVHTAAIKWRVEK